MNDINSTYREQPTLLIGLGGLGTKIVDDLYGKVNENSNIAAFAIDYDSNEEVTRRIGALDIAIMKECDRRFG